VWFLQEARGHRRMGLGENYTNEYHGGVLAVEEHLVQLGNLLGGLHG